MPHCKDQSNAIRAMIRPLLAGAVVAVVATASAAWAQKNSGPLLPEAPAYPVPAPPVYNPPPPVYARPPPQVAPQFAPTFVPQSAPPLAPPPRAGNPDAERLAQSLPLDPNTRDLRDQMPANPRGTEARLGLREPRGPAIDMRGRTPTPREIVDALAPR